MITDETIEAFGNAFWSVNAASKIDVAREEIRRGLEAAFAVRQKLSREQINKLIREGKVFADTNPEADFVAHQKLSCPHCGGSGHKDDVSALSAALSEPQVKVRELEWEERCQNRSDEEPVPELIGWEAYTEVGYYNVKFEHHIEVTLDGFQFHRIGYFDDVDEAKAAAQADYEARILSALSVERESTPSPQPNVKGDQHPDDIAVDRFADAMKAKLAQKRAEGRGGWDNPDECSIQWLSELLRSHVEKADPVDVGNFAMMIHQRGGRICK